MIGIGCHHLVPGPPETSLLGLFAWALPFLPLYLGLGIARVRAWRIHHRAILTPHAPAETGKEV